VHAGDSTGSFQAQGYGASGSFLSVANVSFYVLKDPVLGDKGIAGEIRFQPGAHDAGVPGFAMVVNSNSPKATGQVGINFLNPTHALEVGGDSALRGTLDVTGNITSTGTAHNFAAKSIPASAINGLPAAFSIPQKTPASQTATGTAGEFAYDAQYLYGCVAANDWRRIPWQQWANSPTASWYPVAATGNIYGRASFANGKFFATTTGGNGAWSDDGTNWHDDGQTGGIWLPTVFGNGTYIRGKADIWTSADGLTWTKRGSAGGSNRIVFGAGVFVILNSATAHRWSADGITWGVGSIAGNLGYTGTAGAFGGGVFVGVGGAGATNDFNRSADGKAWTKGTLPVSQIWSDVAYGAGKFVAIGTGLKAAYSANGSTWTAIDMPSSQTWSGIAWSGTRFLAVAENSMVAATSIDGVTWTPAYLPSPKAWDSVASDGKNFVVASRLATEQAVLIPN
jgi:hypothetical protein